LLCLFWIFSSYRFHENATVSGKTLKFMFWNTARIKTHPSIPLIQYLRHVSADFIGFVESGRLTKQAITVYQTEFPEYKVQQLSGGMLCMTKGTIQTISYCRLPNKSRYNLLEIELDKNIYHVMIVDIGSNPFFSRKECLETIIKSLPDRRTIIMGDFNTPYDSVFFHAYKTRCYHAFQEVGTGFSATWPYGIPLLQIDHIWTSKDLKPVNFTKDYHLLSDHAKLEVEVEVLNK